MPYAFNGFNTVVPTICLRNSEFCQQFLFGVVVCLGVTNKEHHWLFGQLQIELFCFELIDDGWFKFFLIKTVIHEIFGFLSFVDFNFLAKIVTPSL